MAKILGIIWLVLGILWLAKPQALKNRLKRKISRKMKWTVYSFLLAFGVLMIGSVIKTRGFLPKIIAILGVLLVIKAIFLFLSKASEKLWAWWADQPVPFFRLQALFITIVGIIMILL